MTIDSLSQLRSWNPPYRPDAIIEDSLLLPETAMLMFGSAKSWKTMHSTHLAFCLATASPWFGYDTRQCTVLKVQVELPKYQDKLRVTKYSDGNKLSPKNIFFYTPDQSLLLDTTYGIQALTKVIEETKKRSPTPDDPLVIILDPVYLLMAGNESDGPDVKKFQQKLGDVRKSQQVTFVIISHARLGKTDASGGIIDMGAEEIMGSSLWNNWCDTMVRFQLLNPYSGSNINKVTFAYHRNAQQFHPAFTIKWNRANLVPEIIQRDIVEEDEPSVRGMI